MAKDVLGQRLLLWGDRVRGVAAADGNVEPSLTLLQSAYDRGLAANIGVSNYTIAMMREAKSILDAPIVTNQVEFHPLLNQDKLIDGSNLSIKADPPTPLDISTLHLYKAEDWPRLFGLEVHIDDVAVNDLSFRYPKRADKNNKISSILGLSGYLGGSEKKNEKE